MQVLLSHIFLTYVYIIHEVIAWTKTVEKAEEPEQRVAGKTNIIG